MSEFTSQWAGGKHTRTFDDPIDAFDSERSSHSHAAHQPTAAVARFLEATFFATFFFVREPGFFARIAVATLSQTTAGAAVAVAAAVAAAAAAAWANSPARILVPSAALLPAATTVSCALVLMLLRVIYSHPQKTSYARQSVLGRGPGLRRARRGCPAGIKSRHVQRNQECLLRAKSGHPETAT